MESKIHEIRRALDAKLYNCALALTLTLPDICAKIEYASQPKWSKGKKYRAWFDDFAKKKFTYQATCLPSNEIVSINTVDGEVCWSLRCAVLHAGNYELEGTAKNQYAQIMLHAHNGNGYCFEHELIDGDLFQIDVIKFCHNICDAVEEYYNAANDKTIFAVDEVEILDW